MKIRLLFLFFLMLCTPAFATNYYVNGSTGSDSNNCLSSGAACLTIAHAESLSAAGDTINIAAGTYRLTSGSSGSYTSTGGEISAKNNQTFIGPSCTPTSSPCSAILSGSVQVTSGQILGPDSKGNYYARGFTQAGQVTAFSCDSGWSGCNYPEDLYVNGTPYQHLNSSTEPVLAANTWWFNYNASIIYLPSSLTPTFVGSNTVEIGVLSKPFSTGSGLTVQNLTVEEFANPLQTAAIGFTLGTLTSSYITLNHGWGAGVLTITNSVLTLNGQLGVGGGTTVTGNTITYNNYAHVSPGFGAGGAKWGNTAGAVIRGNTVSNNNGNGIHLDVNSTNALIDSNTVENNFDSGGGAANGIIWEISELGATVRNNYVLFEGGSCPSCSAGLVSSTSNGMQAYCNVVEETSGVSNLLWTVMAESRGNNTVPPNQGQQIVSSQNYFHHNTFIWDTGATGNTGFVQFDTTNQPNFFSNNTPPDFNTYHASSTGITRFIYDNNNSGNNTAKTFASYQSAGADIHGTLDTINSSGFPAVTITSPADQSTVANPVTINSTASDTSGISKVEFYVDWTLEQTDTISPYNYSWAGVGGTHVVAAMAYSNAGVRSCNAVTLSQASPSSGTYTITISSISGNGVITSSDLVLNCGTGVNAPPCVDSGAGGTVILTETPSVGYSFSSWGGSCSGSSSTCSISAAATVTATFVRNQQSQHMVIF